MAAVAQAIFPSGSTAALSADAARGVAAIGRRWDAAAFDETLRLYAAIHREIDWDGVLPPESFAYGSDSEQTLRLFRPEQAFSEPGPVIVFLHGNGLGQQSDIAPRSDGLIYAHIGKLGAAVGGIGVTVNYRTGEAATRDSGPTDLRLALDWVQRNIASHGGDVDTVVLLASSEGATIAARYLFDRNAQLRSGPGVAAAVLISGLFGDAAPGLARLIERYDGETVPLALWTGSFDTGPVQAGIAELHAQLCRRFEDCPWFEQMRGHNHASHVLALGTGDAAVEGALIRFYHTVR